MYPQRYAGSVEKIVYSTKAERVGKDLLLMKEFLMSRAEKNRWPIGSHDTQNIGGQSLN